MTLFGRVKAGLLALALAFIPLAARAAYVPGGGVATAVLGSPTGSVDLQTATNRNFITLNPVALDANAPKFNWGIATYPGVNSPTSASNDTVICFGWNVASNCTAEDPTKAEESIHFENLYSQGGVGTLGQEIFFENRQIDGTATRPWGCNIPVAVSAGSNCTLEADTLVIATENATAKVQFNLSAGNVSLASGFLVTQAGNNVQWLQQRNAANSAYLFLPYIDSSDRLNLPGTNVYVPGILTVNTSIAGGTFSGDMTFGAGVTAIFGAAQGVRINNSTIAGSSAVALGWSSTTHAYDTFDTTFCRAAVGVAEVGASSGCAATGAIKAAAYEGGGSAPSNSGACAINTQLGGNTIGSFKANGACSASTVILTFATTAPNGWACNAKDLTTPADLMNPTAYTTTTITFTGTMVTADLVTFECFAF